MKAQKLYQQSGNTAAPALSKEELRRRILAVVNARQHVSDVDIWRADAPRFLPWSAMQREIEALHQEQKLRREVVTPGKILIHSLTASSPIPVTATKKPASRKAHKHTAASKRRK